MRIATPPSPPPPKKKQLVKQLNPTASENQLVADMLLLPLSRYCRMSHQNGPCPTASTLLLHNLIYGGGYVVCDFDASATLKVTRNSQV